MNAPNFGLNENTINQICQVLGRYPQVSKAVIYGSRAVGNYRNGSDIDLTLVGGSDLTLSVLYRIIDDVDDLMLPYEVDLSIFESLAEPDLIDHIRRVGITFYEKG